MATNLQITFRDLDSSPVLETRIRERVEKLETLCQKLIKCIVVVEVPHRRHQKGRKYRCRIDMVVPNAELVAENADESPMREDPAAAVDEAFDEAMRVVEDYVQRARWDVKQHDGTPHARVAKLMRDLPPGQRYGFLETHDGREIYFHEHSVLHGNFHKLEIGTQVRFAEEEGDKGPQASTVAATGRIHRETTTTASADAIPESRP